MVDVKIIESNVRIDAIDSNGTNPVDVVIGNNVKQVISEEFKEPDLLDLAPPEANNDMMTGILDTIACAFFGYISTLFDFVDIASMMKRITTEDEAKAALAERRRIAREEAERQAEAERQRLENEREAELERQAEEERRQKFLEEESLRLAEEQRKAEDERLLQAIEVSNW